MREVVNKIGSVQPNQLSFASYSTAVTQFFATISLIYPHYIPRHYTHLLEQQSYFKLPSRREERSYPRGVKLKPSKYPYNRNKNASQLD